MSDDFDNDDLSWLQDDDQPEDDDENLDWSDEEDQPAAPPGGHLGFTRELPWMQDEADEPGSGASEDDDLDLDWLRDDVESSPDSDPLGGDDLDLDWMRDPQDAGQEQEDDSSDWMEDLEEGAAPASSPMSELGTGEFEAVDDTSSFEGDEIATDMPDWLSETSDDDDMDIGALADIAEQAKDVPEWLQDTGDLWGGGPDEPAAPEPSAEEFVPAWLAETDDESFASADETPDDDADEDDLLNAVPDWLAEPEEAATGPSMVDDTGELSSEWLGSGETLPEAGDSDQTFDEWMVQQTEADRVPDLEEQLPSMENLAGSDVDTSELGTGELPDWFLGMEEIDTSDAPDWFTDDSDAVDDGFGEQETGPSSDDLDAFFESLGEDAERAAQAEMPEPGASEFDPPMSFEDMFGVDDEELEADSASFDPAAVPDGEILQALGIDSEDTPTDWYAEEEETDAGEMDWLEELGEIDESALAEAEAEEEFLTPSIEDVLPDVELQESNEVDDLLAAMDFEGVALPDTGDLLDDDADFDTLFSDPAFSDVEMAAPVEDDLEEERPDWLTEAGATVGGLSAAAMLRQRDDRPLDELPDRLKSLRDRGQSIPTTQEDDAADFLPDIGDVESDAVTVGTSGMAVVLSAQQEGQVSLLRDLTSGALTPNRGSSWSFEDDPFMMDEDESLPEALEEVAAPPRRSLRERVRWDRLLIALLLFVLMILPFVADIRIGSPPPVEFGADSRQQGVFDALESLAVDDRVLVAVEYGPTAAGELDSIALVLFQHILERRAQPVVVSSNPVALLRANNMLSDLGRADSPLLDSLERSTPLRPNDDYYVTRYLSGNALGVRALGENVGPLLTTDIYGQPTGLRVRSLDDFVQVIVIVEQPNDLRAWAEQVAATSDVPVLAATGRVGEPLIEPYLGSGLDGLLVGYADALTYASLLGGPARASLIDARPTPTDTPTATPIPVTPTPTEVLPTGVINTNQAVNVRSGPGETFPVEGIANAGADVIVLDESPDGTWLNVLLPDGTSGWIRADLVAVEGVPTATSTPAPTDTATLPPTETLEPSNTPLPSDTPEPSATPTVTATPLPSATPRVLPPTWTPAPTEVPETTVMARVIADSRVNIRSGPGTGFASVGTAGPGDTFVVIGRNADGSWIQIEYPDLVEGQEAWIADFLLEVGVEDEEEAAEQPQGLIIAMAGPGFGLLAQATETEAVDTPVATPTREVLTLTPSPTTTPEASASPAVVTDTAALMPQAEARWSAMNLGLLFIIGVIILGAVLNIARLILRRGR